jgi:hypothetical protein
LCTLQEPACTTPTARAIVIPVSSTPTAADDKVFHLKAKPEGQAAGGGACDVEGLATRCTIQRDGRLCRQWKRERDSQKRGREELVKRTEFHGIDWI